METSATQVIQVIMETQETQVIVVQAVVGTKMFFINCSKQRSQRLAQQSYSSLLVVPKIKNFGTNFHPLKINSLSVS